MESLAIGEGVHFWPFFPPQSWGMGWDRNFQQPAPILKPGVITTECLSLLRKGPPQMLWEGMEGLGLSLSLRTPADCAISSWHGLGVASLSARGHLGLQGHSGIACPPLPSLPRDPRAWPLLRPQQQLSSSHICVFFNLGFSRRFLALFRVGFVPLRSHSEDCFSSSLENSST